MLLIIIFTFLLQYVLKRIFHILKYYWQQFPEIYFTDGILF